ncbi:hypothetical protein BDR26DRAFT_868142 [Obelidium mucronatum]|nr:hypothetical protein BDR26DRAFT_868142 [Obelidium mucronatum]
MNQLCLLFFSGETGQHVRVAKNEKSLAINTSAVGLFCTIHRLLTTKSNSFWIVAGLMTLFNVFSIVYQISYVWSLFLEEGNCIAGNFVANFTSHLFYLSFDTFLLYKTYSISLQNRFIVWGVVILFIHRLVWTVWDIVASTGVWDADTQTCSYQQFPITGVGYNVSDILIDCFATTVAVSFNYSSLSSNLSQTVQVLVKENILRTAFITSINLYGLYSSAFITDIFLFNLTYNIQDYAYAIALNSELFWIDQRKSTKEAVLYKQRPSIVEGLSVGNPSQSKRLSFVASARSQRKSLV